MTAIQWAKAGGVLRTVLAAAPPYVATLIYGSLWGAAALVGVVIGIGFWSVISKKRIRIEDR